MTTFHVAVDHLESPDPDSPIQVTTTYLGTVDQAHVDEVRAIAALDDSPRHVLEHPHIDGAFTVLREDGDLDVYVPVDAPEYRVLPADQLPKDIREKLDAEADEDLAKKRESGDWGEPVFQTQDKSGDQVTAYSIGRKVSLEEWDHMVRGSASPGPAYISGVTRFGDQSIGGAMDYPKNPPRTVWHTTESPAGGNYFTSIAAYLIRVGSEPQVIYDPVTDKLGQFGPLTQSGRALRNDGSRRTNREGKVCIQVEVLGRAASPWTKGFDPANKPNFRKLLAAMRAHGIPDVWPAGKPPATAAAVAKGPRSRTTWQSKGGHYGHCHVPGNSHWDPGAIDTSIVPGKPADTPDADSSDNDSPNTAGTYTVKKDDTLYSIAKAHGTKVSTLVALNELRDPDDLAVGQKLKLPAKKPAVQYEPFPGSNFFHGGRHSPIITAMGRRLQQEGCGKYRFGPGPNWTNVDKASYAAWQRKLGYSGADADGIPGKKSWDALKVPKV